jgi:hypothetical protein
MLNVAIIYKHLEILKGKYLCCYLAVDAKEGFREVCHKKGWVPTLTYFHDSIQGSFVLIRHFVLHVHNHFLDC